MKENLRNLFSIKQTREVEKYLIEEKKVEEFDLMYEAGKSAFLVFKDYVFDDPKILVFCGAGNNGGDGYVFAALASEDGFEVECIEVGDFSRQSLVSKKAKDLALEKGVVVRNYDEEVIFSDEVIVDALLGIGVNGEVKGMQREVINKINDSGAFVISLDCPSGLNCDSGEIMGVAVQSDVTVTFLTYKQGLFLKYGVQYCGDLFFSDLGGGYEEFLTGIGSDFKTLFLQDLSEIIPPRDSEAHKGNFGNILIVGGDHGMGGAVIMAAEAACRSGAGKVKVLTQRENVVSLVSRLPNVMSGVFEKKEDLEVAVNNQEFLVIGPGLGMSIWSEDLFEFFMKTNQPKLLDADALNLLAESSRQYDLSNSIITPHPKEAARLIGVSVEEIQQDRKLAAKKLHEKYGAIVVLKGANSIIFDGKDFVLCPYANPAMAVAGMGDVLSGIIAGLAMQNISLESAAVLGVFLHALSALNFSDEYGEIGLLPSDVILGLKDVLKYF